LFEKPEIVRRPAATPISVEWHSYLSITAGNVPGRLNDAELATVHELADRYLGRAGVARFSHSTPSLAPVRVSDERHANVEEDKEAKDDRPDDSALDECVNRKRDEDD